MAILLYISFYHLLHFSSEFGGAQRYQVGKYSPGQGWISQGMLIPNNYTVTLYI